MRWGDSIELLLKAKDAGQTVPALENRPKLIDSLVFNMNIFEDLGSDRRISSEGIPLPLSTMELEAYYRAYKIYEVETFDTFSENLRRIDNIWLKIRLDEISEKRKNQKAEANKGQPLPRKR